MNLVKLLSPTKLHEGVRDEGNAYFCNTDSGLSFRLTEFNDNGDLVRPLARDRYLRAGNVVGHRVLWVSPVSAGQPEMVYEFPDADVRIDYPVWSPDGKWVLFDRFRPEGGDIWAMSGVE